MRADLVWDEREYPPAPNQTRRSVDLFASVMRVRKVFWRKNRRDFFVREKPHLCDHFAGSLPLGSGTLSNDVTQTVSDHVIKVALPS